MRISRYVNWQFKVIRLGPLVFKQPKSARQICSAIRSRQWGQELSEERVSSLVLEVAETTKRSLTAIRQNPKAQLLCGKPRFLPFNIVIQDFGCSFLSLAIEGALSSQEILKLFFSITHSLWSCGLFETTFDFYRNYGLDRDGKPFFIDLGDFTNNFAEASRLIKSRHWEQRKDYEALDPSSKELFDEMANEELTLAKLSLIWTKQVSEKIEHANPC